MTNNKYMKLFKAEIDKLVAQPGGDGGLNKLTRDNISGACSSIMELSEEIDIVDYDATISKSGKGVIISLSCIGFEILSKTSSFFILLKKATRA